MRTAIGALLAVVAALAAGCSDGLPPDLATEAAPPQAAELGWKEQIPESGPAMVFRVHRFAVTERGWEADVEVQNRTDVMWEIPGALSAVTTSFGVMLFRTGGLEELDQRNRQDDLPGLREADVYEPALPNTLAPGEGWRGTISARGSLAAGLYVRIVFGLFAAEGDPPEGIDSPFSWITDHAYRLQR